MSNRPVIIEHAFLSDVKQIIDAARSNAVRSINFCRVQMYWNIGQRIFEEEQQGKERADYGTYLIKSLELDTISDAHSNRRSGQA